MRRTEISQGSMSTFLTRELVVCGVLFAGLSLVAQHLQPEVERLTVYTGLVGGALCVLWGLRGQRWPRCRTWAMVMLGLMACVFGYQGVESWRTPAEGESDDRAVTALMTVMVVFCTGTLLNLAQEGKDTQS
jgi:peptidoglycan/LPS O-acetylase OafA/YrhL